MSACHNLAIKCRLFGIMIQNILRIFEALWGFQVGKKKTKHFRLEWTAFRDWAGAGRTDLLVLDEPINGLIHRDCGNPWYAAAAEREQIWRSSFQSYPEELSSDTTESFTTKSDPGAYKRRIDDSLQWADGAYAWWFKALPISDQMGFTNYQVVN